MKEKGSAPIIIFIVVITLLSAGIISGFLYFKSKFPGSYNNIPSDNVVQKQLPKIQNASATPISSPAMEPQLVAIADALMCNFLKSGYSFPSDIKSIKSQCTTLPSFSITDKTTNKPYVYKITNGGKGFIINTKLSSGQDYSFTEKTYYDLEEMMKQDRDTKRLTDFAVINSLINDALPGEHIPTTTGSQAVFNQDNYKTLCINVPETSLPCYGSSQIDGKLMDGTGWIKVNFIGKTNILITTLPADPLNNKNNHYSYCANKEGWEINTVLESKKYKPEMKNDVGDDDNKYERGSNLKLIDKAGNCKY